MRHRLRAAALLAQDRLCWQRAEAGFSWLQAMCSGNGKRGAEQCKSGKGEAGGRAALGDSGIRWQAAKNPPLPPTPHSHVIAHLAFTFVLCSRQEIEWFL